MNASMVHRQLTYRLRRLGWQGISGLFLTLAALAYAITILLPASARTDQLDKQITQASARLKQGELESVTHKPTTPGEQLLAFYEEFPQGASVPDWLGKIYAIAEELQLSLDAGEYSLTRADSGRLDKFRIAFPVKGTYPQLRKFISASLSTAPALALDGIYLKRDNVGEGTVEARIVFLLYLEKGA
ncbi:hypothetical protein [Propionivibrio sp.]|uniref:hypothetical protein n=1 Tax=Propionivibrio sp. TaxID=2212460 RepID=UPI003BF3DA33